MKKLLVACLMIICSVSTANAARGWGSTPLTNWELYLNNGVAYILSLELPEHCSYDRAQINMSATEFDKAQYAYVMSAKARNKKIRYVVDMDPSVTLCVITGLREVD
ncbi:hypothetical protein CJF42_25620 [Pseudoalteromonas sp. NBT06-2]|uniref:hypothetical protein n=1 Tax=Pseudoalteromonas sp. NBT06-2 TaxID=2025950 RepID=UPI000BA76843|nr:hypothetical protein [Pseudoalteromonas sp. NBT06-2]PAJ71642.1 hypothetical protein CJF42_25620 [Pseudoalteromonas sp. NBT06-2]